MNTHLSKPLKNLIDDINHYPYIDNELVANMVQSYRFTVKDVEPYMLFSHCNKESYGRTLIYDNGNFKMLLMSWKAGDFTAIHNHGFTEWGCVYTFGEATHRLYEVEQNELKLIQKDIFPAGAIASVCGDLTHMMGNAGSEDFVTLHIYGSNSRKSNISANAKVYVPENQKVLTTMGTAFLNMNKELIINESPLKCTKTELLTDYYQLVKPYYERVNNKEVLFAIENQIVNSITNKPNNLLT